MKWVLDLLSQPVFLAVDRVVCWRNHAAASMLEVGMPLEKVLGKSATLFAHWTQEGTLQLPLTMGGMEYNASVRAVADGNLFVAERRDENADAAAEAVMQAAACLRKPLHGMVSAARELFDRVEELEEPAMLTVASQLNRTMYQFVRLCGQMSDGGQLLHRSKTAQWEQTELRGYFDGVADSVRPLVEQSGRELEYSGLCEPLRADIDPALIERAVYNLLSNALTYTPRGGKIRFTVEQNEQMLFLRITDDGEGIPTEIMTSLFERYATPVIGDSRWGVGLGLTMVREIARLHGGTAMLSSRDGGTTALFSISLEHRVTKVQSPLPRYDYCSGLHHGLVELADALSSDFYDPAEVF